MDGQGDSKAHLTHTAPAASQRQRGPRWLNTYGFAEGDPVSYGDPYGLRIEFIGEGARQLRANYRALRKVAEDGLRAKDRRVRDSSRRLLNTMDGLDDPSSIPVTVRMGHVRADWNAETIVTANMRGLPGVEIRMQGRKDQPTYYFGRPVNGQLKTMAHEFGHAWTALIFRRRPDLYDMFHEANAMSMDAAARRVLGCGGVSFDHDYPGGECH